MRLIWSLGCSLVGKTKVPSYSSVEWAYPKFGIFRMPNSYRLSAEWIK